MKMTDLISTEAEGIADPDWLGSFLLDQGVDLASTASPASLEPGTPVYVKATADPLEVQRRITQAHVRMLFVLDDGKVVGIIDVPDLIERADSLPWPTGGSQGQPPRASEYADPIG